MPILRNKMSLLLYFVRNIIINVKHGLSTIKEYIAQKKEE